jgi:predicted alpha/beta-fold hydrolase
MLSISCYPQPNDLPNNIFCLYTEKGGHVGFVHGELRKPRYFAEEEALRFFDEQSK